MSTKVARAPQDILGANTHRVEPITKVQGAASKTDSKAQALFVVSEVAQLKHEKAFLLRTSKIKDEMIDGLEETVVELETRMGEKPQVVSLISDISRDHGDFDPKREEKLRIRNEDIKTRLAKLRGQRKQ